MPSLTSTYRADSSSGLSSAAPFSSHSVRPACSAVWFSRRQYWKLIEVKKEQRQFYVFCICFLVVQPPSSSSAYFRFWGERGQCDGGRRGQPWVCAKCSSGNFGDRPRNKKEYLTSLRTPAFITAIRACRKTPQR